MALGTQLFVKTENLTRIQILGLIMAFSGIVVAFNESLNLPTREMLIGDIMLLGAAMAWGSGTVLIKASPLTKISPSKVLLYQLWVSAPILLITSMFLGEGGILDLNYIVMGSLIYQIIWIAFITYVVWFWLIRTYPISGIAPFTFLTLLFGVMAGTFLLGEAITSSLLCALVLVGTNIYFVNQK